MKILDLKPLTCKFNDSIAGVEKLELEALDSAGRFSCWTMQVLTTYVKILEHRELSLQGEGITYNPSCYIKSELLATYKDSLESYQRYSRSVLKTKMCHVRRGMLS